MTAMAAATSATAGWLEPGLALGLEVASALPVAAAVVGPAATQSNPTTSLPAGHIAPAGPEDAGSS